MANTVPVTFIGHKMFAHLTEYRHMSGVTLKRHEEAQVDPYLASYLRRTFGPEEFVTPGVVAMDRAIKDTRTSVGVAEIAGNMLLQDDVKTILKELASGAYDDVLEDLMHLETSRGTATARQGGARKTILAALRGRILKQTASAVG